MIGTRPLLPGRSRRLLGAGRDARGSSGASAPPRPTSSPALPRAKRNCCQGHRGVLPMFEDAQSRLRKPALPLRQGPQERLIATTPARLHRFRATSLASFHPTLRSAPARPLGVCATASFRRSTLTCRQKRRPSSRFPPEEGLSLSPDQMPGVGERVPVDRRPVIQPGIGASGNSSCIQPERIPTCGHPVGLKFVAALADGAGMRTSSKHESCLV
jgi:hypothetical protein